MLVVFPGQLSWLRGIFYLCHIWLAPRSSDQAHDDRKLLRLYTTFDIFVVYFLDLKKVFSSKEEHSLLDAMF